MAMKGSMVGRRCLSVHRATVAAVTRLIQGMLRMACIIAQWRDERTVQGYGTGHRPVRIERSKLSYLAKPVLPLDTV